MQVFNTDTLESRLIKAILYNNPTCRYKSVSEGDYVIIGVRYIYRKSLVICTKTGYINDEDLTKRATYVPMSAFDLGVLYPKYTERYCSSNLYYDIDTHIKLGEYLRLYRDVNQVDLMPFYNCACPNYSDKLYIECSKLTSGTVGNFLNASIIEKSVSKRTEKVFKIPVKFDKDYTIYFDSDTQVTISGAIVNNDDEKVSINTYSGSTIDLTNKLVSNNYKSNNSVRYSCTRFKQPFIVNLSTKHLSEQDQRLLYKFQKDLYLLIQVAKSNDSSLVVLEGNYLHTNSTHYYNEDGIENCFPVDLNVVFTSELSLTRFNDKVIHPFSNRLIEYLVQAPVTNVNPYDFDIEKIQSKVSLYDVPGIYTGIWSNTLRSKIYKYQTKNNKIQKIDLNGFLDKDTEEFLMG